MCGADCWCGGEVHLHEGSSPRVRSRPSMSASGLDRRGIISACAEQTRCRAGLLGCAGDHLRVCGADYRLLRAGLPCRGSSPRVRSRRSFRKASSRSPRIISACAEQTLYPQPCSRRIVDHLRVCGADLQGDLEQLSGSGSSPRVRSRPADAAEDYSDQGIISACAEQTVVFYCGLGWSGVAEYLIHALRGVGKRRGCQYLE